MSYKIYKLILIFFLLIYLALGLYVKFVSYDSDKPLTSIITIFSIALISQVSVYLFILYAKVKGVKNSADKKIAPSKAFKFITKWIVLSAFFYAATMLTIDYKTNSFIEEVVSQKEWLSNMKNASNDSKLPADKRLKSASIYYKNTGKSIKYLNNNMEREFYSPNKSDEESRKDYLETINNLNSFYRFTRISSMLTIVLGITVLFAFFYIRKIDKLRQPTNSI